MDTKLSVEWVWVSNIEEHTSAFVFVGMKPLWKLVQTFSLFILKLKTSVQKNNHFCFGFHRLTGLEIWNIKRPQLLQYWVLLFLIMASIMKLFNKYIHQLKSSHALVSMPRTKWSLEAKEKRKTNCNLAPVSYNTTGYLLCASIIQYSVSTGEIMRKFEMYSHQALIDF